jgi:putative FmdB family regulatory protein
MPFYEYQCEECATRFEQRRSMADAEKVAVCPLCASLLTIRVISAAVWIGSRQTEQRTVPTAIGKTHRAGCGCCIPARKR